MVMMSMVLMALMMLMLMTMPMLKKMMMMMMMMRRRSAVTCDVLGSKLSSKPQALALRMSLNASVWRCVEQRLQGRHM